MTNAITMWNDINSPHLESVNLEITNFCNYTCSFCSNSHNDFRKKGNISYELINKVISELPETISLLLCGVGEPSLHPNFVNILKILSLKFFNLSIVTNGTLFRKKKIIDAVLSSNIKKINISLDEINSTKYKSLKGGSLETTLNHIKNFISYAKSNGYELPFIQINYLYDGKTTFDEVITCHEIFDALLNKNWCVYVRKIKNLGGTVDVTECQGDNNFLDKLFANHCSRTLIVENWERYLATTNFLKDKPKICRHLYKYYMLLYNGDVTPCCIDFNAQLKLFNVFKDNLDLYKLFHNETYVKFRTDMEHINYKNKRICRSCDDYYKVS